MNTRNLLAKIKNIPLIYLLWGCVITAEILTLIISIPLIYFFYHKIDEYDIMIAMVASFIVTFIVAIPVMLLINELKRTEAELRKSNQEADASNKAKSEFLANMSHEIRTPMNNIIGMADLLIETELNAEQKKYIKIFKDSGEHLLGLINSILDLSKIESGKVELEKEDFDIFSLIRQIDDIVGIKADEKHLKLTFYTYPDVPRIIIGDSTYLMRVLINLVGNAIKFTEEGEINVEISILNNENGVAKLLFSVMDTGMGIPEEKKKNLFQTFSQADTSITRKYGGTGLGLAISKKIVEMMGGDIWVDSTEEKGSTFYFTANFNVSYLLPTEVLSNKYEHVETLAPKPNLIPEEPGRVLLVDDSEDNRQLIMLYLNKIPNLIIDTAENGQIAVDKYKENKYDIVLMDIQMPVLDGYSATRAIREWEEGQSQKKTPILALTAGAFREDEEKGLAAGCSAYLTKPIKKSILLEYMAKFLSEEKS